MFLHLHTKAITLIQRIWCQIIADTKYLEFSSPTGFSVYIHGMSIRNES